MLPMNKLQNKHSTPIASFLCIPSKSKKIQHVKIGDLRYLWQMAKFWFKGFVKSKRRPSKSSGFRATAKLQTAMSLPFRLHLPYAIQGACSGSYVALICLDGPVVPNQAVKS
jgi:hypothetical protein